MKYTVRDLDYYEQMLNGLQQFDFPFFVSVSAGEGRNNSQNALLWAMCSDIADQVDMPLINGQRVKASPENWKQFLTGLHDNERRIAVGENGEMIVLSRSTSRMNKAEFSSLVEFMMEFCARRGVKLSKPIPAEYMSWANER